MNKSRVAKKRVAFFAALFMMIAGGPAIWHHELGSTADAAGDAFEDYLKEQGFPESYWSSLKALHQAHPNWIFEAYHTGLSWDAVVTGEMAYKTNLTPNTSSYPTSYHATSPVEGHVTFDYDANAFVIASAPYWVQASREAVSYYMDPRNFLNGTEIFQFELLQYSSAVQNLEGVERILSGTFMENAFVAIPSLYIEEGYVSGFAEGTTGKQFRQLITCESSYYLQVWNADGTVKADTDVMATGDYVTVANGKLPGDTSAGAQVPEATRSKRYECVLYGDLNGDGMIERTDYLYFKRHFLGYIHLEGAYLKAADVNFDSVVDRTDRLYIKRDAYGYAVQVQRPTPAKEVPISGAYALWGADGLTYAQAFQQIGEELNVSPYMLAARVRQEQGAAGTSQLISGTYSGYEGYYNYFNVKAAGTTQTDIIVNGLQYAKEQGWNTRYKSLYGGSVRLSENYIAIGQNTLYFQKFNVITGNGSTLYRHQYMQNLLGARNESINMVNTYTLFGCIDNAFVFRIPVYNNMPATASPRPVADGNPNNYLYTLSVDGYELLPNFTKDTLDYTLSVSYDVKAVNIRAEAIANVKPNASSSGGGSQKATISGTGQHTLQDGKNVFSVTVTAGNGSVRTYTVTILREPDPNETVPDTEVGLKMEAESGAEY